MAGVGKVCAEPRAAIKEAPPLADMDPAGTGVAHSAAGDRARRPMSPVQAGAPPIQPDAEALGATLTRVLTSPLSALRASIEALAAGIGREDPRGLILEGALDQVLRMARDVQSLVEYAAPRSLSPLRCSLNEIARAALQALPPALRPRVQYAQASRSAALLVDGPLFSSSIGHLLWAALDSTRDAVLLQVRAEPQRALFAVVQGDADGSFDPAAFVLDGTPDETATAVRLAVARRDIERMGGTLRVQHTARGLTCVTVELPLVAQPTPGGQEDAP